MALEVLRVFQEVTGSLSGYSDSNKATADGVGWGGQMHLVQTGRPGHGVQGCYFTRKETAQKC